MVDPSPSSTKEWRFWFLIVRTCAVTSTLRCAKPSVIGGRASMLAMLLLLRVACLERCRRARRVKMDGRGWRI